MTMSLNGSGEIARKDRLVLIDALRFTVALGVVCFHYGVRASMESDLNNTRSITDPHNPLRYGYLASISFDDLRISLSPISSEEGQLLCQI
jgi:peptidoglycan/LPS O-acetylase OafA/YrhL